MRTKVLFLPTLGSSKMKRPLAAWSVLRSGYFMSLDIVDEKH